MTHIFKKYEFETQEKAHERIEDLDSRHVFVELGFIVIEEPTFDENEEIVTEAVFSDMYSVDVLWQKDLITDENGELDEPYGWRSKEIVTDGNGAHTFAGYNYTKE
jgi:hypothetical protein